MKHIMREREDIDKYISDKELIANTYVMRCYFVSMIVYSFCCLLNFLDFFIVDKLTCSSIHVYHFLYLSVISPLTLLISYSTITLLRYS